MNQVKLSVIYQSEGVGKEEKTHPQNEPDLPVWLFELLC